MFYHVSFHKESKERYKTIPGIDGKELKYDALGRLHLDTPYSGHCHLRIHSYKYNSTTAATHITDLYDILAQHKHTKSVYMFLADGGLDFTPSHIANNLFYYWLFKKLDADILAVMTCVARYSVFNPIKQCWSPLSNKLSHVIFSPLESKYDVSAPALQSRLSKKDLKIKEKIVFDHAMNSISE